MFYGIVLDVGGVYLYSSLFAFFLDLYCSVVLGSLLWMGCGSAFCCLVLWGLGIVW